MTVLGAEQIIPADIDTVWLFFTNPSNLAKITPPYMNFNITGTDFNERTYAGQVITYTLTPFMFFRTNWVTEITHLTEKKFFTDEQRFGPYRFWHHRHIFSAAEKGTVMKDIVTFKVPGWLPGKVLSRLAVEPRVEEIFRYREKKIIEIFGKTE
jgi:ligand-binding SRPBCC domain-containing protein